MSPRTHLAAPLPAATAAASSASATRRRFITVSAAALGMALPTWAGANALPGRGITVLPLKSNLAEETFQTLLVMRALERLGYTVRPFEEVDYPLAHMAVANGDATLIANHWNPHHSEFYKAAGGDAKLYRKGVYTAGAVQGYMIDKKTADAHQITHLHQLKDPKLAKLFDTDGSGKASLIGPEAGWGGEAVVNHQLKEFGLSATVRYTQGRYAALITETLARFKAGQPVLYYAWTPHWLSSVLVPGKDAIWLQVPYSSMPGVQAGTDTAMPNGRNYGFPLNNEYIVANKAWAEANPAAAKLFELMHVPIGDISAQNRLVQEGQSRQADIERHVDQWIRAHQKTFDGWIAAALKAGG